MLEVLALLVTFGVLMFAAGMRLATILHRSRRGDYDTLVVTTFAATDSLVDGTPVVSRRHRVVV